MTFGKLPIPLFGGIGEAPTFIGLQRDHAQERNRIKPSQPSNVILCCLGSVTPSHLPGSSCPIEPAPRSGRSPGAARVRVSACAYWPVPQRSGPFPFPFSTFPPLLAEAY